LLLVTRGQLVLQHLRRLPRVVRVVAVAVPVALEGARAPSAVPVARLLRDALGRDPARQLVPASLWNRLGATNCERKR
jgi:hypothetical protein